MIKEKIKLILTKILNSGGFLLYGEECEHLFLIALEFLKEINCKGNDNITSTPENNIAKTYFNSVDSYCECDNCFLSSSLQHPDVKFIFPSPHDNIDDFCGNYINEFKSYFLSKGKCDINSWAEYISTQGKQVAITNKDIEGVNDFVASPPVLGKYKTVVILFPEVMNKTAANMLLKTLEEPLFENVFFLLVTNDIINILPTIQSRCVKFFIENNYLEDGNENLLGCIPQKTNKKENDNDIGNEVCKWLENCYLFDSVEITNINESISSSGKVRMQKFLKYTLHVLNNIFYTKIGLPSQQRSNGGVEVFPYLNFMTEEISLSGIYDIVQRINTCIYNLSRNVNLKIMFFDLSVFIYSSFKEK